MSKFDNAPRFGVTDSKAEDVLIEIFLLIDANTYAAAKEAVDKYKQTFVTHQLDSMILFQIKQMKKSFEATGNYNTLPQL